MGIVVLLVIGIAGLVGLMILPTVFDIASAFSLVTDTPLYDIIQILPYAFGALIIIGIVWTLVKGTQ